MTSPAGWYPDTDNPGLVRYWDGVVWTDHRQPAVPSADHLPRSRNGFGIAALVVGIFAVVTSWFPPGLVGTGAFMIIGVILGGIGLGQRGKPKAAAAWGLGLSLAAGAIAPVVAGLIAVSSDTGSTISPVIPESGVSTVTYEVTSDGSAGAVTYITVANGTVGQEQNTNAALPFTYTFEAQDGFNAYSLVGQAGAGASTISCKITVNGEVLVEQTSTGQYAVVTCAGS